MNNQKYPIQSVHIKNLGAISDFPLEELGAFNLITGANNTGKTFLLKAIYATIKAIEGVRGEEFYSFRELLVESLHWTFDAPSSQIISKGQRNPFSFEANIQGKEFWYEVYNKSGAILFQKEHKIDRSSVDSYLISPKEIVSIEKLVLSYGCHEKLFGFGKANTDLAKATASYSENWQGTRPENPLADELDVLAGGYLFRKEYLSDLVFKSTVGGKTTHQLHLISESSKQLATLALLLRYKHIQKGSVLFIDTPEAYLNKLQVYKYMEMLIRLALSGVQIFVASSYDYFEDGASPPHLLKTYKIG